MATLWSCAIAVVLGLLITRVAGRRAGAAAALLSGLLSSAPVIEGFTANGELMATLPALAALALTARWHARGGLRVMFAAGLFAGAGVLVKQSGYDGGLAAGLWLLLSAWRGWRPAADALRALAALALGVALIVGAAALHGALTGFHDWWFAVADYRLSVESVATGSVSERFSLFTDSLRTAGPVVGALDGARPARPLARRCDGPRRCSCAIWFVLSLTGFALGGLFHGHYYVGPLTPLCALAALTLAARAAPRLGLALGLLTLVLPVYKAWPSYTRAAPRALARVELGRRASSPTAPSAATCTRTPGPATRSTRCTRMRASISPPGAARPIRTCGSSASSTSRAPCSGSATRSPGPSAPRYIAVYQQPRTIDKSRAPDSIRATLHRRYRQTATVEGIALWRLVEGLP